MSEPEPRDEASRHTLAHRVSLAASLAVLAALAIVLLTGIDANDPARPVAETASVRVDRDGRHHVVVDITNQGDRAAQGVQVSATLAVAGEEQTGDQTIDFLGAGEQRTVVFVFDEDPASGDLEVRVTSFSEP